MNENWMPQPPATGAEIENLKAAAPFELPETYLEMLRHYNGGEGEVALPPMWLQLWSVSEVIENLDLEFYKREFPGHLFFASKMPAWKASPCEKTHR